MTHGETRKPTRCPDCNGRDWQPRSDGRCNECGDKADQERTQEQDAVAALRKRVAELEGLLGEAWPFLTRYPAIECLSQRIERALSRKDGEG